MVGTNDFNSQVAPQSVLENYIILLNKINSYKVDIYVQTTLECVRSMCGDQKLNKIREFNKILMKFCIENNIKFIDINKNMTTEHEGLLPSYSDGGVHLNDEGYSQWARELQPYFRSWNN